MVQNQHGNNVLRWDNKGTVVETTDFDKYTMKIDGSERLTVRNRRFLWPVQSYKEAISHPAPEGEAEEQAQPCRGSFATPGGARPGLPLGPAGARPRVAARTSRRPEDQTGSPRGRLDHTVPPPQ